MTELQGGDMNELEADSLGSMRSSCFHSHLLCVFRGKMAEGGFDVSDCV